MVGVYNIHGMGTSESPNFDAIFENIRGINKNAALSSDLNYKVGSTEISEITGLWTFATSPKFGSNTGFLKSTSGVLSFVDLGSAAVSNSYNDLDDLPSLFSGDYSDLSGLPTIPSSLSDLSSPTANFDFGNKALKNLSNLIIGSNATSFYQFEINNCNYTVNLVGSDKSSLKMMGAYTADYFNTIDFYYNTTADYPSGRFGYQFTGGGSFFVVSSSNNYGVGTTHFNFASGYFTTEAVNAIKLAESLLFTTNNIGSIGTASVAPSNIYSVNALTVTSDNDFKKDINKNLPLGLDFVKKVAKTAIATYSWQDTIIPEQKTFSLKKIEKIDNKTKEKIIDYELEEKVLQEEKKEVHSRKHFGFLGVELYQAIIESDLDTNQCAFLSIDDPDQKPKIKINAFTCEKTEEEKKPFEVKIENNRPKGKITIKPTEMLPIIFKAIAELSEQLDLIKKENNDLKQKINILEQKGV